MVCAVTIRHLLGTFLLQRNSNCSLHFARLSKEIECAVSPCLSASCKLRKIYQSRPNAADFDEPRMSFLSSNVEDFLRLDVRKIDSARPDFAGQRLQSASDPFQGLTSAIAAKTSDSWCLTNCL